MFWRVMGILDRTDTDLGWETKQNKNTNKTTRGVNVHSVVYASVGCDSVSVVLCGGVRVICSFCVEIEHT